MCECVCECGFSHHRASQVCTTNTEPLIGLTMYTNTRHIHTHTTVARVCCISISIAYTHTKPTPVSLHRFQIFRRIVIRTPTGYLDYPVRQYARHGQNSCALTELCPHRARYTHTHTPHRMLIKPRKRRFNTVCGVRRHSS